MKCRFPYNVYGFKDLNDVQATLPKTGSSYNVKSKVEILPMLVAFLENLNFICLNAFQVFISIGIYNFVLVLLATAVVHTLNIFLQET